MTVDSTRPSGPPLPDAQEQRLRQAARELEGVFVAELFKAMRETVPSGGVVDGGMGEEIFTSLFDQHLAPQVGAGWQRGIGEALYRQLRAALPQAAGEESGR